MKTTPSIAIAHDYLTQRGGAERVVLSMAKAFPGSPVYTTLYDAASTFPEFRDLDIRVSRLNRIPWVRRNHRSALPLLPAASSSISIDADVVLASSSGWAHGFKSSGRKLVYCYSPARWLYQRDVYLGSHAGLTTKIGSRLLEPALRKWDREAAGSCDTYLAISSAVRDRIMDVYGRVADVLPAPFGWTGESHESLPESDAAWIADEPYYLCVSRLLPYKNVDKVMGAFESSGRRLVVVGQGPEWGRLKSLCPTNVLMLANLSDAQMRGLYARCTAVVAASREDYGLTPLEAASFGKPSAVLRWGGFLDTINEGVSGVYFNTPDASAISAAIDILELTDWSADEIRGHVDRFSEERFIEALRSRVGNLLDSPSTPKGR